jgi:hypothetical protein
MAQSKIRGSEQILANSVTSGQVDSSLIIAAGTNSFTGNANLGGNRATNAANASAGSDLVTLSQVQSLLMGLSPLLSVQAMTTGAETYTIASGAVTQINGTTIDGVTLAIGDRILVKNAPASSGAGTADSSNAGSDIAANGIYTVTGNTTNLTVSRDSTSSTPLSGTVNPAGKTVFAEAGAANKAAGYIVIDPTTPDTAFTYGTTAMQWGKFNASGGSVTTLSIVSANGLAGTVANPSTTPAVTITTSVTGIVKGNGTALSAATAGTDYFAPANFVNNETPSGSVNSSNTAFTLANTPNVNVTNGVELYLNGVLLEPGAGNDFTVSGTSITMAFAPATGDKLRVYYIK